MDVTSKMDCLVVACFQSPIKIDSTTLSIFFLVDGKDTNKDSRVVVG